MTRALVAVVPAGLDDPARPSGGNTYDRRVLDALPDHGWRVCERPVSGSWPRTGRDEVAAVGRLLCALPDGAVVLVDGLVASAAARALGPESARLRLAVLVHMPLNTADERELLRRSGAVITTSRWTRDRLIRGAGLDPARVTVAEPGADVAAPAGGSADGDRLLSVGVLARHKGQDLLVDALTRITDRPWSCTVAGALDVEPEFAERVRRAAGPLGDRIRFRGPLVGADLAATFAAADLLVLPSRAETFGMVIGEALARAIPVVAADVGGVGQALGRDPAGVRPGRLVVPDDPAALAAALREWLADPALRARWRQAATARRETLLGWATTARLVSDALAQVV